MNKKLKILIISIILIIVLIIGIILISKFSAIGEKNTNMNNTKSMESTTEPIEVATDQPKDVNSGNGITVVPTMLDSITSDSGWCGTFQLIWNDMKNEVVKQDIVFNPQLNIVENLNKEDFKESMISEDYYFKIYGLKNLELKEKIERGIKEKFNQTSDIINNFDWSEDALDNPNDTSVKRYFFYTMLYRKFEFLQTFDKLNNDKFGNKYNNIKYFGIDENTEESVRNQIEVLYYNSKDDFAILINTKTNDEVIFCKNPTGNNFNDIYVNMNDKSNKYFGSKKFNDLDEFKAPQLTFNEKKEYTEIEGKRFETADPLYPNGEISKALQTIQFSLDEKGGEVKSEAGADVILDNMTMIEEPEEPRYFYVDDSFAIFLREKGREKPYFAGRIEDITKFQ